MATAGTPFFRVGIIPCSRVSILTAARVRRRQPAEGRVRRLAPVALVLRLHVDQDQHGHRDERLRASNSPADAQICLKLNQPVTRAFTVSPRRHSWATYGDKPARARVGSLTEMKRNICLPRPHFKGFQPLHFKWQPYRRKRSKCRPVGERHPFDYHFSNGGPDAGVAQDGRLQGPLADVHRVQRVARPGMTGQVTPGGAVRVA